MAMNESSGFWNSVRKEIDRKANSKETFIAIRNDRQGYRSSGMYQLSRYSASEGVMVVGITRGGKVG